jgi:hypothetical protein
VGYGYDVLRHIQQYFSYIVAVSFIDGENRSTRRKLPTCSKSLTTLSHNVVSSTPRLSGVELSTLVVIRTIVTCLPVAYRIQMNALVTVLVKTISSPKVGKG